MARRESQQFRRFSLNGERACETCLAFTAATPSTDRMATETDTPPAFTKDKPYRACISERRHLNAGNPSKETLHLEVDLGDSGLQYKVGDSLGVWPRNDPATVEALLKALGFTGGEKVNLPKGAGEVTLREGLMTYFAIGQPTQKFAKLLRGKVTAAEEQARLDDILEAGDRQMLRDFLDEREYLDLAEEYPSARFEPQEYVDQLRKLVPRLYSIASSPLVYPDSVHLTLAVVRYQTNNRQRGGVASTFLGDRARLGEPEVPVFVQSSHFNLPEEGDRDIIMVGPGTGIAPFRAFVQERVARGEKGRMWLFFGDQHRESDYLYGEEWEKYHYEGMLDRLDLAFSRDQEQKVYVQDRIRERGPEIWKWLDGGAAFYVCGDAKRMARDVDAALHDILRDHGGMSENECAAYLKLLKQEKRYQRDVY